MSVNYGARQGHRPHPFGHRWFIQTNIEAEDVPVEDIPGRRYGDVGYVTLEVPDGDRARRFCTEACSAGRCGGGPAGSFHISSITPAVGHPRPGGEPEVRLYFRVDDLEAAADRGNELGGEVLSVADYDSGGNAECRDDQGLRFDLFRPRPGY